MILRRTEKIEFLFSVHSEQQGHRQISDLVINTLIAFSRDRQTDIESGFSDREIFFVSLKMDQADLYDQFGNYMGPELESDEEEDDDQQNGYRQELANVDETSDMVRRIRQNGCFISRVMFLGGGWGWSRRRT